MNIAMGLIFRIALLGILLLVTLTGCSKGTFFSPRITAVSASCSPQSVFAGASATCTAFVSGTNAFSPSVIWQATNGTVTSGGVFTAAQAAGIAVVTATSVEDPTKSFTTTVTVMPLPPTITSVSVSCSPTSVDLGSSTNCSATVTGTNAFSKAVNWTALGGTITATGVFTGNKLGAAQIIATSVEDPTKVGSATVTVTPPSSVTVNVIDLPSGVPGSAILTDSSGKQVSVTTTITIPVPPGTYTLTAAPVTIPGYTYFPLSNSQIVTVVASTTAVSTVDYKNVMYGTTKVLEDGAASNLTISPDGTVLTIPASSMVAQTLHTNDVLIVPPTDSTGAAPIGLLRKVSSVSVTGGQILAVTQPATLTDAFQRLSFDLQTKLTTATIKSVQPAPGVRFHPGAVLKNMRAHKSGMATPKALADPCTGFSLGVFDIEKSFDLPLYNGISLSGGLEVCSGVEVKVDLSGLTLNSASATANLGAFSELTLAGNYSGSFTPKDMTIAEMTFHSIPIGELGPLPLYIVPKLSIFVGANGNVSAGFSTDLSTSGTFSAGVAYDAGQWSPIPLANSLQFEDDPPTLHSSLSAKGYVGVEGDVYVEGLAGIAFKPDAYLDLEANPSYDPWWTLTGGVEGPMSFDIALWGLQTKSYSLGALFDYNKLIAQSQAPVCGYSISPDTIYYASFPRVNGTYLYSGDAAGSFSLNASGQNCNWKIMNYPASSSGFVVVDPPDAQGVGSTTLAYSTIDTNTYGKVEQFLAVADNLLVVEQGENGSFVASFDGTPSDVGLVTFTPTECRLGPDCFGGSVIVTSILPNIVNGMPYYFKLSTITEGIPLAWKLSGVDPSPVAGIAFASDGSFSSNGNPVILKSGIGIYYPRLTSVVVTASFQGHDYTASIPVFLVYQ